MAFPTLQAERAGPRRARGLRMKARRAKTWRSQVLVHASRAPKGSSQNGSTRNGHPTTRQDGLRRPREAGSASSLKLGLGGSAPDC